MTARDELVNALARRYAVAGRAEKTRILDEFVAIAGFHRKHAMRLRRRLVRCGCGGGLEAHNGSVWLHRKWRRRVTDPDDRTRMSCESFGRGFG